MKIIVITSQWPTPQNPSSAPFIVREVEALRRAGADVEVFAFNGGFSPTNYLRAWAEFHTKLRKSRYDIVHAQFGVSGLLALFPKNLPLVVTYQGSDLNGIYSPDGRLTHSGLLLRRVSQFVALWADEIIVVSASMAKYLPRRENYSVIPGGIDLGLFRPIPQVEARRMLNLSADRRYVLFTGGRENPVKRYTLAQQALENLRQTYPSAELLLVNSVSPDQVPIYMGAADCLLITSSREGSPNVVKEALACNLPVVSVDVGDVRERVGHLSGCVVCDNDDPKTIAAGLRSVLERSIPFEGRSSLQSLDIDSIAHKIVFLYQKMIPKD